MSPFPTATRTNRLRWLRTNPTVTVLVIGGGINGAATFRDLALQGVDCLIVDKGDWCSGTSAAPSRLIHGGLKYLETGELRLVAESTYERNRLLRNAPHFVKPLPTMVPIRTYFGGLRSGLLRFAGRSATMRDRGLLMVKTGLTIYDWLGRKARVMPRHALALRATARRRFPGLDPTVRMTLTYFDARVTQAERLCYELVADGEGAHPGAVALNYVTLAGAAGGCIRLRDETTGELIEVKPQVVVNAAGPWIDRVNHAVGLNRSYIGGSKGSHLLIDHPKLVEILDGQMIYFGTADGRICLVYPFFGRALLGTTDIKVDDPDAVRCDEAESDYMLARLNELFPQLRVTADRIVFRYTGVRPLPATVADDPGQVSRDHSIHQDVMPGSTIPVLSLVGGKWTTFRAFAEEAANAVLHRIGRQRRCSTAAEPIGGGRHYPETPARRQAWISRTAERLGIGAERATTLLDRYGTAAEAVLESGHGSDRRLEALPSYSVGEIQGIAAREQVVTLADLLFRRTAIAVSEPLTTAAIDELAATVAPVLGWTGEQCRYEAARTAEIAQDRHGMRLAPA